MKRSAVWGILFFIGVAAAVFFGSFAVSYWQMREYLSANEQTGTRTAASQETVTTRETAYVLETYDTFTHDRKEEELQLPNEYIACTREQLAEKLEQYEENPSEEDIRDGFIDYSLVYFSPEKIVVRKNYDSSRENYQFCIVGEHGKLTVYDADRNEVYEYTDISVDSLPNSIRLQVTNGLYVKSEQELFDFLESYSS